MDNTNWMAGRAGWPCFQMKNVNFRQAAQKTERRQCCSGSGFLESDPAELRDFLDPDPDWISFLLKPDPDPDDPKRFKHFLIFLRFVFFLRKFY